MKVSGIKVSEIEKLLSSINDPNNVMRGSVESVNENIKRFMRSPSKSVFISIVEHDSKHPHKGNFLDIKA
jgi:hypothetical protein